MTDSTPDDAASPRHATGVATDATPCSGKLPGLIQAQTPTISDAAPPWFVVNEPRNSAPRFTAVNPILLDASHLARYRFEIQAVALRRELTMATKAPKKAPTAPSKSPSSLIDGRIKELGDWRGETLAHVRALIKQVVPDVVEEWKWRGVPVWYSHKKIICTGETYKAVVKLTFAKGATLKDPAKLFNSSLDGNVRRAIDIHENEAINEPAFKKLILAAAALNQPLK
jgi:hypothetical protein